MTRMFVNKQVTRESHPTIGHAIAAALNEYPEPTRVVGIIYHPADPECTWRSDRGEYAEVILDIRV
jgi:hypothetical protein